MLPRIEEELVQQVATVNEEGLAKLHEMLTYHMGWQGPGSGPVAQGKRIRPILTLLSLAAAGGDWELGLPAAAAVELIHNFSLIHDDIQDDSELRRGRETVWKIWGVPQAINAGDALFSLAHLSMQQLNGSITFEQKWAAGNVLRRASLILTQGQFLDLDYEARGDLTVDSYWPMIQGKTASLLSACAEIGAILAGVSTQAQSAYCEFGNYLGLAFQVHDDYLGIWGNAAQTGKSAESDLLTGKKSLPILYGLKNNDKFAKKWQNGSVTTEIVPQLVQMLDEEGAKELTIQKVDHLSEHALAALEQAGATGEAKQTLQELTELLAKREN
ncbi:MAG: polyprenyl synthetase family protein [Chloroflexota bacterium]